MSLVTPTTVGKLQAALHTKAKEASTIVALLRRGGVVGGTGTRTEREDLSKERLSFLGFTFGRQYSWTTGRAYIAPGPSREESASDLRKDREANRHRTTWPDEEEE